METSGELTAHLTSGAVAVYAIQYVKSQSWFPWMNTDTKVLNRYVNGILAAVSVMGISWSYDPSVGGTIQIPAAMVIASGLWEFAKQYILQQVIYDGVVEPASRKEITVKLAGGMVSLPAPKSAEEG